MKINLDLIYPVGSIYMNVSDTIDPNVVFGGTWELIKNRFLIGAGGEYSIGTYGGEKTVTLTAEQIPKHEHRVTWANGQYGIKNDAKIGTGSAAWDYLQLQNISQGTALKAAQQSTGGQAHNNMPPYLAVAMWLRTA